MCLFALALIVGIILGESLYGENVFFRFVPLALIIAAFVALLCIKKVRRFVFIAVAIAIGFLGVCASNDIYDKHTFEGEYECVFSAKVASEILGIDENYWFFVEDIYVGGKKLKYQGYVHYVDSDAIIDFNAGDVISISGKIESIEHKKFDSYHANDVADGYGYLIATSSVSKLAEGELHPLERLPYLIKSNFYRRMDGDSAAICTALVLGDKSGLDEELKDNISASGLAHVLAVSGLHIAVISSAIFFLLRKCKVNAKISMVIVFVLSLFYCFLCDFTASSLRALIMMTVLNISVVFGKKRDTLSTISFAAIIILIFRPTALMEAGFLMSFAAVLGIALFYGKFYSVGMKIVDKISPKRHVGKYLAGAVSLSLSANLVAFPFIAYFFKRVTILFVLSNIVVLPYLMLIYAFLLFNTTFSLIVGWSGNLVMFKYLLIPFKGYVKIFGGLSFVTIPVSITPIAIVGLLLLFFFVSKYIFAKRITKFAGAIVICAVTIVLSTIYTYCESGRKLKSSTLSLENSAHTLIVDDCSYCNAELDYYDETKRNDLCFE